MYKVEVLDNSLNRITQIQALAPLRADGTVLEYSKELSNYGMAQIRVATKDPLFTTFGDILQPYANHLRITRAGTVVWQGVIISNPQRTTKHVDVHAYTYTYLLQKVLINMDPADGKGGENYRTFKSGTMASAINTLITEAKTNAGSASALSHLTIGTIENPLFPANFTDANRANIGGQAWNFSDFVQVKLDYKDALYAVQAFGVYAQADFEITNDLVFNFKTYIGNKQPNLVFSYGAYGAIEDYNIPLDGAGMANEILGIAADNDFNVLKEWASDSASVNLRGKIQTVAAFSDVKSIDLLRSRLTETLKFSAAPDSEIHCFLNSKAYPLGQYDLGDTVTFDIQDHIISVRQARRIVGIDVSVHNTGRETIKLTSNLPRENQ